MHLAKSQAGASRPGEKNASNTRLWTMIGTREASEATTTKNGSASKIGATQP